MEQKKRLYRDTENQRIFGVCSGLADYFDTDATIVRVIWLMLILFAGTGILAYLIFALVMEPKSEVIKKMEEERRKSTIINDDPFAKYD
jgi:phage shock protein C